ncbi:hypothetical protein [Caldalkalibacillus salinus]|uniref:hypothetical protein n=1 Tax=Caldalkalibacillus salinus TaxID=2803787 RepID=UPI001920F6B5|nr:hypothetical protein [Caldalkalibacillus salinus]
MYELGNGEYAIYKNKIYKSSYAVLEGIVNLFSSDPQDINIGFIEKKHLGETYYLKTVKVEEIDKIYYLFYKAVYKGKEVGVSRVTENGKYVIFQGENQFGKKYNFSFIEPGVWEKEVLKEELEKIWKEKSHIFESILKS